MKLYQFLSTAGVALAQNKASKCVQCRYSKDVTTGEGTMSGSGDGVVSEDCFDLSGAKDEELTSECVRGGGIGGGNGFCYNEFTMEWRPDGRQIITVRRGCRNNEWIDSCEPSDINGYQTVDCHNQYSITDQDVEQGKAANAGNLQATMDYLLEGHPQGAVASCQSCHGVGFIDSESGEEIGDEDHPDFDACKTGSAASVQCPPYASATCFNVETISVDLRPINSDPTEKSYRRGCSYFDLPATDCNIYVDGLKDAEACKDTCVGDNCNGDTIEVPANCYTCEYQWDDHGQIGIGDPRCNDPSMLSSALSTPCPADKQFCVTERQVEWIGRGNQIHTSKRYCSNREYVPTGDNTGVCQQASSSNVVYKDCFASCNGKEAGNSNCNNNNDVVKMFEDDKVDSCKKCYYDEETDTGDRKCGSGDVESIECPSYSRSSCYAVANWHQVSGKYYEEDYRGCSSFSPGVAPSGCENLVVTGAQFNICKELCTENDCNTQEITREPQCYECQVTVDHHNNTVGYGDTSCWDGKQVIDNLIPCASGKCHTELQARWSPRGETLYTLIRGCQDDVLNQPQEKFDCRELGDAFSINHAKECYKYCDGDECNGASWGDLADLFSTGNVESCHTCTYIDLANNEHVGNSNCRDNANHSESCPKYADNACASTSAVHQLAGELAYEVHKSCSPFNFGNELDCFGLDMNQGDDKIHFDVCKELCDGNDCNSKTTHPEENSSTADIMLSVSIFIATLYL